MIVGAVWFAWTEDPSDQLAKDIRAQRDARKNALAGLADRLHGMGAGAPEVPAAMAGALGFFGMNAAAGATGGTSKDGLGTTGTDSPSSEAEPEREAESESEREAEPTVRAEPVTRDDRVEIDLDDLGHQIGQLAEPGKLRWSASSAALRVVSSMTQVIRTSDVEIISMFTPASASVPNIRAE